MKTSLVATGLISRVYRVPIGVMAQDYAQQFIGTLKFNVTLLVKYTVADDSLHTCTQYIDFIHNYIG